MRIMKRTIDNRRLLGLLAVAILCLALIPLTTTTTLGTDAGELGEFNLTLDEYPACNGTVEICGAIWAMFDPDDATGSGIFHSFFRMGADDNERGYNTDWRLKSKCQFDEVTSKTFTHSVLLADVPKVMIDDIMYREFQLDINEQKKDPTWYLSMDEFQVWTTDDPNIHDYQVNSDNGSGDGYFDGADLVYNLDGCGEDWWIMMDYRINPGSGKRDYRVLVPDSDFPEDDEGLYCVIYARHGLKGSEEGFEKWASDDGYEEWGVAVYPAVKSGYKFHDLNYNGEWDDGEPGLNDWIINLVGTDADGHDVTLSTITADDADGNPGYYEFEVDPGEYTVSEVQQDGWYQSCPTENSGTYIVTLGNGDLDPDNNFGNYQHADLSVTKTGKITYTIVVDNDGPSPALNVIVSDPLPGYLDWDFVGPPPSGWQITGAVQKTLTGSIALLAVDASVTVTVEAEIDGEHDGSCTPNAATASSTTPDPNPDNNTDHADIRPLS